MTIAIVLSKRIDNVENFFVELLIKSFFLKSYNNDLEQASKIINQLLTLLRSILGVWRDNIRVDQINHTDAESMQGLLQVLVVAVLDHIVERILSLNCITSRDKLLVENSLHADSDDLHKLVIHQA